MKVWTVWGTAIGAIVLLVVFLVVGIKSALSPSWLGGHSRRADAGDRGFRFRDAAEQSPWEGVISGAVEMADGSPLPADTWVDVHIVGEHATVDDDTRDFTLTPDGAGEFTFTTEKQGTYALVARADGFRATAIRDMGLDRRSYTIILKLAPAGTFSGRVVNEWGEPVANAGVFVVAWKAGDKTTIAPREFVLPTRVATRADGTFALEYAQRFPEVTYRLAVSAPGYATHLTEYVSMDSNTTCVLVKGGVIAGRIVHEGTDRPAEDMLVSVDSEFSVASVTEWTDADGRFVISRVPTGAQRVRVIDDQYVLSAGSAEVDVSLDHTAELPLTVTNGGAVSGRVFNANNDRASRTRIAAYRADGSMYGRPQTPDRDGAYRIGGLAPGLYRIGLWRPRGDGGGYEAAGENDIPVRIEMGSDLHGFDFAVPSGQLTVGRVGDENGMPLGNTSLSTASDGSFVRWSEYDKRIDPDDVEVAKAGYALFSVEVADDVRITMVPEGTISGWVVDDGGNPMGGVEIAVRRPKETHRTRSTTARRAQPRLEWFGSTFSAVDGAFSIYGLPPGDFRLQYQLGRGMSSPVIPVKVSMGQHVTDVQIVDGNARTEWLTRGGRRDARVETILSKRVIEGQVVSKTTGLPVPAFRIAILPVNESGNYYRHQAPFCSFLDVDGKFSLASTNAGHVYLMVEAEGFASGGVRVESVTAGETKRGVVIRMEDGATYSGRVVDGSGKPMAGVDVSSDGTSSGYPTHPLGSPYRSKTGVDGKFWLRSLWREQQKVSVTAPGYAPMVVPMNFANGGIEGAEIVLSAGGTVSGWVTLDGIPMENQHIGYSHSSGILVSPASSLRTDVKGNFQLTQVPVGELRLDTVLQARGMASITMTKNVAVRDGKVSEVELRVVRATADVEGTINLLPGLPPNDPVDLGVSVVTADGSVQKMQTKSDNMGRFRLEGLQPGRVQLQIHVPRTRLTHVYFDVAAGQQMHKDIPLFGGGIAKLMILGGFDPSAEAQAFLFQGDLKIEKLSADLMNEPKYGVVAFTRMELGMAQLDTVDSGTYTVLAIIFDKAAIEASGDSYAGAKWATTTVQLKRGETTPVQLKL